jgi:rSAM/selenodomain-associated transferase 1
MKNLLIIFVKNAVKGNVKTRLANRIGDSEALSVYKELLRITEIQTLQLDNCDIHVYFSNEIDNSIWPNCKKFIQEGGNLGERMKIAFKNSFKNGYQSVIGIGSDLPDLNSDIIARGFLALQSQETVFGPSEDGGYYLLGMNTLVSCIFENKAWSTAFLLNDTIRELEAKNISSKQLRQLNDIDTFEDFERSSIFHLFPNISKRKTDKKDKETI